MNPDYSKHEAPKTWLDAEDRLRKFQFMPKFADERIPIFKCQLGYITKSANPHSKDKRSWPTPESRIDAMKLESINV